MASRAVLVTEFGTAETLTCVTIQTPEPGPGEVRVSMKAAGLSFADILIAEGRYQVRPLLPFVPGSDFAGQIDAVGEGVSPKRIGERVCGAGFGGAMAAMLVVPSDAAVSMPDSMTWEQGSVLTASYTTAYHALVHRGRLQPGEQLCVLGAAGAVGLAAIQIGKALGAKVIASASSEQKRAAAIANGADIAIDSSADDWRAVLRAATNGCGPDVVVDPLGDRFTEAALRSLAWNGRLLVIGFAAGNIPSVATNLVLLKGAQLVGVNINQFGRAEPEKARTMMPEIFKLYAAGFIHTPIDSAYTLSHFGDAVARVKQAPPGRVIVTFN